ncbi:T9SS type A sorting domain-containing protein [Candidatus Poribacteria bacterium]|nr:T9SS type A sorting domain-containing protein [Candidatus Poribacteria bacterium]
MTTTSSVEVVAIEDVETPIGVFKDCVKIKTHRAAETVLAILREEETLWLAPDVGPVKFYNDDQDILFQLASYNLVEPPPVEEMPVAEEPTATEEMPVTEEEPAVEEPMAPNTFSFDLTLEPGLNMVSIPLMPEEPYTAKSLAEMLNATLVIRLDTGTQDFVTYTILNEGDGFSIDGGKGYIVNTPTAEAVTFTGTAWNNQSETEADDAPAAPTLSTHQNTWAFVVTSNVRGMETDTGYTLVAENLRTGNIATENITSDVKRAAAVWADLNRKSVVEAGDKLEIALYDEQGNVVSGPFQRTVTTADIRNAFLSLQLNVGDVQPKDTILAQNFPNPFNPETWIPYQLSKPTEVTISIHNIAGQLVRTLDLGLQPVGSYMTPSTAAYWDGKNAVGEHVSSGIYFYTLQTADFAATRRMVILK